MRLQMRASMAELNLPLGKALFTIVEKIAQHAACCGIYGIAVFIRVCDQIFCVFRRLGADVCATGAGPAAILRCGH